MTEAYCGKFCEDCTKKDQIQCPGCKSGPGGEFTGICELAKCCRSKYYESCETCNFNDTCKILENHQAVPFYIQNKLEAEANEKSTIAKHATLLGKWLWIFFWLMIANELIGLVTEFVPSLALADEILPIVFSVAYGLIFLRLMSLESNYKVAGFCYVIATAINAVELFVSGDSGTSTLVDLIPIFAIIATQLGRYCEYHAHKTMLTGIDDDLAEKWGRLWKWMIITYGALIFSLLLVLLSTLEGVLLMLAAWIGSFAVDIIQIVYVYQTAQRFRALQNL